MNQNLETNRIITGSLFIIATIAVSFILNFAQPFLVPLVLALLIRILIDPIIDYQIDFLHIHRVVAVFVSLCLIIFLFIIIVPFIGSSVITFLQSADDYNNKVLILVDLGISKLKEFNIDIDRETIRNSLNELPLLDWASRVLSNSASFISKFVLVVIMTLFLLLGKKSKNTSPVWNDIIGHVKKYIFTKFITSSITGVAAGLIYWFLGLELAFIFGSLTFILNFIPVVGSIIAVLLPIPIAILQYQDLSSVLLIIFLPAIIHQIIGNVVEPKIFGDAFGLHPITILLSLIFWGMIWGIIGVLLAAPLTAIIRVSFERFDSTRQIARFLEGKVHLQD
ncbi:AI-2E family transporter [Alphaproteobacteria bacterium]|nr:AI-2E family transporter [Alphaproteobacteria bacterium]